MYDLTIVSQSRSFAAIDTPRSVIAPPPPGDTEGHVVAINTAKAWGCIKADGTIVRSYNVQSVSRTGTGEYTVTLPEGNLVAKDVDSDGDPEENDPLNIVVLAEQQDFGIAGERNGNANDNNSVMSKVTVANKKLNASRQPSFQLRVSRVRMPEFDTNDDGNGRNRTNYSLVNPDQDAALFGQSGSEGVINFVVFDSNDPSSFGS